MAIYLEDPRYPGVVGVFHSPGDDVGSYKIGENRGRPRIWIDGKKLAAAGFVGETKYTCYSREGEIVCAISLRDMPLGQWKRESQRKVTGRASGKPASGKPIIDICGADVEAAFPGGKRVKVTFSWGKLVIEREE